MIDGIYAVVDDAAHGKARVRRYSIVWNGEWYNYVINYTTKHTVCYKLWDKQGMNLSFDTIIPLNEADFTKTMERMEKLLLLK